MKVNLSSKPSVDENGSGQLVAAHNDQTHSLSNIQETFSSALAYASEIEDAYKEFTRTQKLDGNSFNRSVDQLERMDFSYRKTVPLVDEIAARNLKSILDKARQQVQDMNMASEGLTKQDLLGLSSFFTPPVEDVYIDKETGEKYVMPDHSKLLSFGSDFFLQGGYSGEGLARCQKFGGGLCDVLYLKKKQDQIDFEFPKGLFSAIAPQSLFDNFYKSVVERQQKQQSLQQKARDILKNKLPEWKYETFQICGYKELLEFGLTETDAQQSHAILFYYRKIG